MSMQMGIEVYKKYLQSQMFINSVMAHPRFEQLRNLLAIVALIHYSTSLLSILRDYGITGILTTLAAYFKQKVFTLVKSLPVIKDKIQGDVNRTLKDIEVSVLGPEEERGKYRKFLALPEKGLEDDEIYEELDKYRGMSKHNYEEGKTTGCVYNDSPKLSTLLVRAMEKFLWSNPLHASSFPGVRKMESEAVQMIVDLFHGTSIGACGAMTSGGTESILMAIRAHKEWAREHKGITKPHIVIPVTAHAAFDKAADYFGIRLTHVPMMKDGSCRVDVAKVKQAIGCNTIMIVGSCPQYPHGVIDNIEALSELATKNKIGLHVDCCLGSLVVPFLEGMEGTNVRPFDFRLPGVTSISCDTHKYGFSPKGSSIVMYRTKELRRFQYYCQTTWPGGVYASPSMAGSRPGSLIVGCWAALVKIGRGGYAKSASELVAKCRKMTAAVRQHPELFVFGDPQGSIFSFGSNTANIYQIGGYLHKRGWELSYLQFPSGLHVSITALMDADAFVEDLKDAMTELRANPSAPANSEAKFYGTSSDIPDRSIIETVARGFVDATYALM